jgi:threonine aldolase
LPLRQNRIFSAAALHGLDHHLATVQTNIIAFHLPPAQAIGAPTLAGRVRERGVLLNAFASRTLRAVSDLDVNAAQCEQAARVLLDLLGG